MSARIVEAEEESPLVDLDRPDAAQIEIEDVKHFAGSLAALIAENINRQERTATGIAKENTVWDVYNNEARKVDIELVKDWRESLNFLLVFAAIFAAVLTAFIIESKKMLEPDQTELLVNVTIWNINNDGNRSNLPYSPPDFEPTSAGVLINCLLFASLGASLVAALASVVSLQWVADYDAAITRGGSSPEDRAKRRQFRFAGLTIWKMSEIIAALPLLLYSSVILFWAGAIQWMWSLNYVVGYVVAGGTLAAVMFYASTTLLGAVFVSAPFRTPLSRGIYWVLHPSIFSIREQVSYIRSLRRLRSGFHMRTWSFHLPARIGSLLNSITAFLRKHILPSKTTREREDTAAKSGVNLEQQALIWLAHQLPITADSRHRLRLLLTEVLNIPPEASFYSEPAEDPWLSILESFSGQYMRRILGPTLSEDKYEDIGIFLRCIERLNARNRIPHSPNYVTDPSNSEYWSQCCFTIQEITSTRMASSEKMAFLLIRDLPLPSFDSERELGTTVELIRWRNLAGAKKANIWIDIFAQHSLYSAGYLDKCFKCFKSLISHNIEPLWQLKQGEERCQQVMRAFEAADYLLQADDSPQFHFDIIYRIYRDMSWLDQEWPCSPRRPTMRQRVGKIKDPCLTLLAELACGVPVNAMISGVYRQRYKDSIHYVGELLYKILSPMDSEASWQARAEVFGIHHPPILLGSIWKPQYLTYLQRILRHPTDCSDHSHGPHHPLYHLYKVMNSIQVTNSGVILLGNMELVATVGYINPILGFLSFCNADHSLRPFNLHHVEADPECIERIFAMCRAVKQQPASVFLLLKDMAVSDVRWRYNPNDVALILESVEQAGALPEDDDSSLLLRPLAQVITVLQHRVKGKASKKELVAGHAKRIAEWLYTRSASKVITSHAHLRMLACARASTSAQPAIARLPMHIER